MDRYGFNVSNVPSNNNRIPVIYALDSVDIANESKHSYTQQIETFRDIISIELIKAYIPNPDMDNYVSLGVNGYNVVHSNTSTLEGCFCVLVKNSDGVFSYDRTTDKQNKSYTKFFTQPTKIGNLKIDLRRPNNGIPSYGGTDHLLVFEIHTLNQPTVRH